MWSVIGHVSALAALERSLRSNQAAHAYLFVGPAEIGKRRAALEFAAGLNCLDDDKPCGICRSCRDTLAASHPDIEIVEPGGICDEPDHKDHAESIDLRICQVRRLERILSLSPYAGGRRVAIVDAADSLRAEAANAFLKTLEEPPSGSVIILLAESPERLPDTVLSRCQVLAFHRLTRAEVEEALKARGVDEESCLRIAAAASGRLGWALKAAEMPALLETRDSILETAQRVAHAPRAERFRWAKGAESRSADVKQRYLDELEVWEGWWRDVLVAATSDCEGRASGRSLEPALFDEGKLYKLSDIVQFLKSLRSTREMLRSNVDPRLALENLVLDLPG